MIILMFGLPIFMGLASTLYLFSSGVWDVIAFVFGVMIIKLGHELIVEVIEFVKVHSITPSDSQMFKLKEKQYTLIMEGVV